MKRLRYVLTFMCILLCASLSAKVKLNLPTKVLGGESYYLYKVKGKETLNGISHKLGIPVEDIILYNPSAAQGVTKKQLLFFPVADFTDNKKGTVTVAKQKVVHQVKKGQSLYGIARIYNVTVDDLVAANPNCYNDLKEGDDIIIPVNQQGRATTATTTAGTPTTGNAVFHTIQKGESMYSVAKQYNTTIENLLAINPGIYPNNFIEGDVIKIIPNTPTNITIQKDVKQMMSYVAAKNDTYESIAKANNVNVEELKAANPDMKKVKKGKTVYIPKECITSRTVNSSDATEKQLERTYANQLGDIFQKAYKAKVDGVINIAIILPFQLQKQNPPRQAFLYTDFYNGFLLAVDSIGKSANKKLNINVYDTQNNLNVTDSILALDVMKKMDVIIAPSEPKQLERCNEFGLKNNVCIINCFSSKNEDYASNPMIIQLNMPASFLASAVNEMISTKFKDYEVVFLRDTSGEDAEIISDVKQHLKSHNFKSHTIDVINPLDFETVSSFMDPGTNYLFIPTSSTKQFFTKISDALVEAKEKRFDCEISLLGHPEYLASKGMKASLQKIDSYVYSRFFIANDKRGTDIKNKFKATYGEYMIPTTPSLGILGFDLGSYIISTLANEGSFATSQKYFDGVQMDIELQRSSNWSGYINKCVELVHFNGSKATESIIK